MIPDRLIRTTARNANRTLRMFVTGQDRKIPSNDRLDERLANESRTRSDDDKNMCVNYKVGK